MELLVRRVNDHTLSGQPLLRRKVLHPDHDVSVSDRGEDLVSIAPFLGLSSLREAYQHWGNYLMYKGQDFWLDCYTLGDNLEDLGVRYYTITPKACPMIFKSMRKLKAFDLHHAAKDTTRDEWDARSFVQDLMVAVGGDLGVLNLTLNHLFEITDPVTFPLHGFVCLKKAELTARMFYS